MERRLEEFTMEITRTSNETSNMYSLMNGGSAKSDLRRNGDVSVFSSRGEFYGFILLHVRAMDRDHATLFADHETSSTEVILKSIRACCDRYPYIVFAVSGLSREVMVSIVQTVFNLLANDGVGEK